MPSVTLFWAAWRQIATKATEPDPSPMALAIFDIDGTLVRSPSTERRFYAELLRTGNQGPRQVAASALFLLLNAPRYGRQVFKKNKAYLAWLRRDKVQGLASSWLEAGLAGQWIGLAVSRLRMHQERGDRVLLLSGAPQFIAEGIAAELGVTECIGTRFSTRGQCFDWRAPTRHPFGVEKLAIAADYCRRAGIAPADVIAYADSRHDLPLLYWCGRPVAVCPDAELLRVAGERHWDVIGDRGADGSGGKFLIRSR